MHFSKWKTVGIIFFCFFLIMLSLPSFINSKYLPSFLNRKISYGLDLRGGVQLLLKVDFDTYVQEQMEMTSDFIRKALRKKRIRYTNLKADKGEIFFNLKEKNDSASVKKIIYSIDRDLNIEVESGRANISYSDNKHEQIKLT